MAYVHVLNCHNSNITAAADDADAIAGALRSDDDFVPCHAMPNQIKPNQTVHFITDNWTLFQYHIIREYV